MSEQQGNNGDIAKALGWNEDIGVGGWGDKKPEEAGRTVNQSRRDFLKVAGGVAIGVGLAASGIGGESRVQANSDLVDEKVLGDSETLHVGEVIKSLEYDGVIDALKEVSQDLIGSLNYEYLTNLKDKGIDGFGEISHKLQESWAWKLDRDMDEAMSFDFGLDRVWYAMLGGDVTRETLEKLFVENIAGGYWAGEIVKSNQGQFDELEMSGKTDDLVEQLDENTVDYRQVVKDEKGIVSVERDAEWDKRKYKPVRAVMLGLAKNSVDGEICKRSGGGSLNELVGKVVGEAETLDKSDWVWNKAKMAFEINVGDKTKSVVDIAIGEVHDSDQELLVGIEEEILGMQETAENRKLAHGVWEKFVKSEAYNAKNSGAIWLADELVGWVKEELTFGEEDSLVDEAGVKRIVKGYADFYFSDGDRENPSYRNMVELIRLMSVGNGVAEQVEEVKQGLTMNIPKGEEQFFQDWPRDEEGGVDWKNVDYTLVQKRDGVYLYQKGPIEDYNDRKGYGNMMPMRAFLANCLGGRESLDQIERRWTNVNGKVEIEKREWRDVIEMALEVLVNTKTDDPWFEKNSAGKWQTEFGDSALGNVHTDGTSGEARPSELYGQLVAREKDRYD